MAANQWSCPGVWSDALGDPRDMAKADCLNPNLQKMQCSIRRKDARNRCRLLRLLGMLASAPPGGGAIHSERIQGDEWGA